MNAAATPLPRPATQGYFASHWRSLDYFNLYRLTLAVALVFTGCCSAPRRPVSRGAGERFQGYAYAYLVAGGAVRAGHPRALAGFPDPAHRPHHRRHPHRDAADGHQRTAGRRHGLAAGDFDRFGRAGRQRPADPAVCGDRVDCAAAAAWLQHPRRRPGAGQLFPGGPAVRGLFRHRLAGARADATRAALGNAGAATGRRTGAAEPHQCAGDRKLARRPAGGARRRRVAPRQPARAGAAGGDDAGETRLHPAGGLFARTGAAGAGAAPRHPAHAEHPGRAACGCAAFRWPPRTAAGCWCWKTRARPNWRRSG